MRKQNSLMREVVSLWVAVALLVAPLAAPFAAVLPADDTAQPVHANHAVADMASPHADYGKVDQAADATGHKNTSCAKHEQCSGKCCSTCAQCFTATSAVSPIFLATLSPRLSAVPRLHDRLVVAGHNRPPAI